MCKSSSVVVGKIYFVFYYYRERPAHANLDDKADEHNRADRQQRQHELPDTVSLPRALRVVSRHSHGFGLNQQNQRDLQGGGEGGRMHLLSYRSRVFA